jgi:hypothetical protein
VGNMRLKQKRLVILSRYIWVKNNKLQADAVVADTVVNSAKC